MQEKELTLSDYLDALKRRKKAAFVIGLVLFAITVAAALLLPPVYRSQGTILIKEQEIPQELVRSTVTSFAAARVQSISQRVMTATNLNNIIEKYSLYQDDLALKGFEDVLVEMQEAIEVEPITAEVTDPANGRPTEAIIAFSVAFEYEKAELAQQVANELVGLFLSENQQERTVLASEAATFLDDEAQKLDRRINEIEARLAGFKERHVNELPELMQLNQQLLQRTESEIKDVERQAQAVRERRIYLQAQLSQIDPNMGMVDSSGRRVMSPEDRLRLLESEYTGVVARYGESHPDRVAMKKEIDALRSQLGLGPDSITLRAEYEKAKGDLDAARERYSEAHPDVKRLERQVAALEKSLAAAQKPIPQSAPVAAGGGENPAYIQLKSQIEAANSELKSFEQAHADLVAKRDELEKRLIATPQVEREYNALNRELQNATQKYQETQAKAVEARLAESLEKDRKGERFELIDPARLPEYPDRPNRLAIVLIGAILSIGGGIGGALAGDVLDNRVHGPRGVLRVVGASPLAVVPIIQTAADRRRRNMQRIVTVAGTLGVIVLALFAIHLFFRPLDVIWFQILHRIELLSVL